MLLDRYQQAAFALLYKARTSQREAIIKVGTLMADALEKGLITQEQTSNCLRQLNNLLVTIQRDKFDTLSEYLDSRGL